MEIAKKISKKKYYHYDKYYTKEEALKKALEIKQKAKEEGRKIRTYIEEIEEYGTFFELFLPVIKYNLWLNE